MNVVFITFIISIIRYEIVVKRIHIYSLTSCGKNANLKSGSELNMVIKIRLKKKTKQNYKPFENKKKSLLYHQNVVLKMNSKKLFLQYEIC